MRAIKKFLDIITKVAPKVYLQLWRRSHWPGSSVVKSAVKANISMKAYQFCLHQSPSSEVITKRTWYVTCSLKDYSSFVVSELSTKLTYLHTEGGNKCMA